MTDDVQRQIRNLVDRVQTLEAITRHLRPSDPGIPTERTWDGPADEDRKRRILKNVDDQRNQDDLAPVRTVEDIRDRDPHFQNGIGLLRDFVAGWDRAFSETGNSRMAMILHETRNKAKSLLDELDSKPALPFIDKEEPI